MRWADQLIKLSNFEVELLQKRLAEVADRRARGEMRLAVLTAEGEAEALHARQEPEAAYSYPAYEKALKVRKADVQHQIDLINQEEAGARDALSEAFETLKKYEHVAESARLVERKAEQARERAELDEIGLRRAASR